MRLQSCASYEAWVIYNFLSLYLEWVGGPGAVVLSLSGRILKPSWFLMTCCIPPIPLDGRFIRKCKQGCLQFVILKRFLVAVTLMFYAKGKYKDGNFNPRQSFVFDNYIYNLIHIGSLRTCFVLCGLQGFASAIQSNAEVRHNKICCILASEFHASLAFTVSSFQSRLFLVACLLKK